MRKKFKSRSVCHSFAAEMPHFRERYPLKIDIKDLTPGCVSRIDSDVGYILISQDLPLTTSHLFSLLTNLFTLHGPVRWNVEKPRRNAVNHQQQKKHSKDSNERRRRRRIIRPRTPSRREGSASSAKISQEGQKDSGCEEQG